MTEQSESFGDIVWHPTADHVDGSHIDQFMRRHGIRGFPELMARSTADVAWLTDPVQECLDVQFQAPY